MSPQETGGQCPTQSPTFLTDHPRRNGASSNGLLASRAKRTDNHPKPPAIPVHQRLGFRPAEFAALVGVSYVTIWRAIKRGDIEVVEQNGIKVIPRSYAVKAGYITPDDAVTGPAHDTRRGQPRPHPVT